jgi:hypothetical protein
MHFLVIFNKNFTIKKEKKIALLFEKIFLINYTGIFDLI